MSFIGRNNSKITNRPSGGGDKKQGLAPKATQFFRPISSGSFFSTNAGGQNRFNFYGGKSFSFLSGDCRCCSLPGFTNDKSGLVDSWRQQYTSANGPDSP